MENGIWKGCTLSCIKQMALKVKNEFKDYSFKPWIDLEMLKLMWWAHRCVKGGLTRDWVQFQDPLSPIRNSSAANFTMPPLPATKERH